jgi:hypothetical protein
MALSQCAAPQSPSIHERLMTYGDNKARRLETKMKDDDHIMGQAKAGRQARSHALAPCGVQQGRPGRSPSAIEAAGRK